MSRINKDQLEKEKEEKENNLNSDSDVELESNDSSFELEEEVKEEILFDKIIEIDEINKITREIENITRGINGENNAGNKGENMKKFQLKMGISDLGNRPREGQLEASWIFIIGLMTMLYILLRGKLETICQIYDITNLEPNNKKWLEHQIHIRDYLRGEKSILAKGSFVQEIVDKYENLFNQSEESVEMESRNEKRGWIELLTSRKVIPNQKYTIHISVDEDFLVQFNHPDFISGVILVMKWFELNPSEHLFQCHDENNEIKWENLI